MGHLSGPFQENEAPLILLALHLPAATDGGLTV